MFQIILLLAVLALTVFYFWGRYNENFWKKRGVAYYEKNKILGVFWDFLTTDRSVFEFFGELYKKYEKEPAVGVGLFMTPALFVIDTQNIRHVLQNDFRSFSYSGFDVTKEDLLANNVIFMNGPRWKLMRQKMSPLFTANKLRNMYYILDKSAQDFVEHLRENPEKLKGNGFNTINEFCCAAIAATVFGIGTESTYKSPYLKMARAAVEVNWVTSLKFIVGSISANLTNFFRVQLFKEHEELFFGTIKHLLRTREKENVRKHDFVDICLSIQKAGTMKDSDTGLELEPTDELLAAQGFFFFIAGVEPAAAVMFGTLCELGKRPDILKKVHQEIDEIYEKHDGKMTFDIISEMKYLDQVLSEGTRMHPPNGFLTRDCVNDSVLPVGNITVPEGTRIFVPVHALHYDPKFFPEPNVFDPERFAPEKRTQSDIAYLPFGKGGRACIGMRYARLQLLAGLVHLLRNYSVVSHVDKNAREFARGQFQVRKIDNDIELIPRTH